MQNSKSNKSAEEVAALRARFAARFAAKHEGQVSRNNGKVLVMRNGVWTR